MKSSLLCLQDVKIPKVMQFLFFYQCELSLVENCNKKFWSKNPKKS